MHNWGDRGKNEGKDVDSLGHEPYQSPWPPSWDLPLRAVIEDGGSEGLTELDRGD